MIAFDALKAAVWLLLIGILQVSLFSTIEIAEARPEVALVALISVALLRGAIFGAVAGFWVGLVLDVATLETLGLTSLVLTIAGYACGRWGEATKRSSAYPLLIAVGLASLAVSIGLALLHFMLGDTMPVSRYVFEVLLPTVALNLVLAYPVYWLTRLILRPTSKQREVTTPV